MITSIDTAPAANSLPFETLRALGMPNLNGRLRSDPTARYEGVSLDDIEVLKLVVSRQRA